MSRKRSGARHIATRQGSRKFDGYNYSYYKTFSTKGSAQLTAKGLRRRGDWARVLKTSDGYAVFRRFGRRGARRK